MISSLCGKLIEKKNNSLIVEVGGIFYEVLIPTAVMSTLDEANATEGTIKLITYHYHQLEPSRSVPILIGFANEVEREFFEKFITVSGVGPKAAVRALSLPISRIASAIDQGDVALLKSLPGIGNQRAREIVAKLQGKVGKYGLIQDTPGTPSAEIDQTIEEEALQVLLQLQYRQPEALKMIKKALSRCPDIKTTEGLLNEVYYDKRKAPGTQGE